MDAKPRLLERVGECLRLRHYSYRTEQQYVAWIRRFILFHGKRHPAVMGGAEVEAFLSHLATQRGVSASTQNQALSALLFLYRGVLNIELQLTANWPFRRLMKESDRTAFRLPDELRHAMR